MEIVQPISESGLSQPVVQPGLQERSWVFRCWDSISTGARYLFGLASLVFLLAVVANVPVLQILVFGYLLEVSGRLANDQPLRNSFVGLSKAAKLGAVALGAWLCLWPIRLVSKFWLDAYIIAPDSPQQQFLATLEIVLICLLIGHVFLATVCGGKLRYFFWPLVAPFSFGLWFLRWAIGIPVIHKTLQLSLGWISKHFVEDLGRVRPLNDWFLPAIAWKKFLAGSLYADARDGLWDFVAGLRLWYYTKLGFKGLVGSLAWLALPTWLLIQATSEAGPVPAICGVVGSMLAIPVFSLLPFLQVHFARDGRLHRFLQVRQVLQNVARAPFAHLLALLLTLVFALPLFLLKIEPIPREILWTLSLFFIAFALPARWICGWAYRRGTKNETPWRWWIRFPVWGLLLLLSFVFVFLMFFTRYITWNGAYSLIENHVFLIPAPFWLGW